MHLLLAPLQKTAPIIRSDECFGAASTSTGVVLTGVESVELRSATVLQALWPDPYPTSQQGACQQGVISGSQD